MPTRIKRYEERLDKLDELLGRIESEMGAQARLETREFRRGGILGIFGGLRMIEIVATAEVELGSSAAPKAGAPTPQTALQQPPANSALLVNTAQAPKPVEEPNLPAPREDEASKLTAGLAAIRKAVGNGQRKIDIQANEPVDVGMGIVGVAPASPPPTSKQSAVAPRQVPEQPQVHAQQQPVAEPTQPEAELKPSSIYSESPPAQQPQSTAASSAELAEIKNTISELSQTLGLLIAQNQQDRPQAQIPALAPKPNPPVSTPEAVLNTDSIVNPVTVDPGAVFSGVQRNVFDRLLDWNIGPYDAIGLINSVLGAHDDPLGLTEDGLTQLVTDDICRNVLLSGGIELRSGPPGKVVALVGATGIGKTTTIAKLAAHFAFQGGKRVSLISLDNYRIAAVEQLRTYTEIMGIDLDIVFSKEEFDQVLTQRAHNDLILIDTAGRSPQNTKQIFELRDTFSTHPPDEIHLVVSASTKGDDLRTILENFEPLSYDHVIVSKLDETRSLGCVYNINKMCKMPISYFTVGQSVPEDIRTATLSFIQDWIDQGRIV